MYRRKHRESRREGDKGSLEDSGLLYAKAYGEMCCPIGFSQRTPRYWDFGNRISCCVIMWMWWGQRAQKSQPMWYVFLCVYMSVEWGGWREQSKGLGMYQEWNVLLLCFSMNLTIWCNHPNFSAEGSNETWMRLVGFAGVGPCSLSLSHTHTSMHKQIQYQA